MQFFRVQKILKGMPPCGEIPSNDLLLKKTILIAWPSLLESFLISMVNLIDMVMVSSLGSYAIAAVGLTTQPKFIGLAIFISLNVAISAIVARRRGENDRESANKVLMQALMITLALTAVVSVLCIVFADPIIMLAGSGEDTHPYAAQFFKIIMGGMIFNTVTMVINAAQRGAGNTKIAMHTNLVDNLVNVFFNYLLIEGHLGFPRLGVEGAAIATVIGSACACAMSIRSVTHKDQFLCFSGFSQMHFDSKTLRAIRSIGSSTLAEQVFMRIGFLLYSLIVAKLGTVAFAAHQIGMNLMSISFSFGDGLSVAAVTLVGQSLGAKREDMAKIYGGICQRLGLVFAGGLSVIFLLFGRQIYMLFSTETEILDYGAMITTVLAVIIFLQISQVIFSGCLRGAGDTVFIAVVSLISVTVFRPGTGWLFCYPLGLGLFGAWLGLAVDQLLRFTFTWTRFKSGKWTKVKI